MNAQTDEYMIVGIYGIYKLILFYLERKKKVENKDWD